MYSYGLLEPGCYYLVQETIDAPIGLIRIASESDYCMYVFNYNDQLTTTWKRRTDPIYDIIECLSDRAVDDWEKQYNSNEGAYQEEEDEE
jgi:hypothetical protein